MRKVCMKTICVLGLFIFVLVTGCNSGVRRTSQQADLSGKWSGFESDWGWVMIQGNRGTYSDTYDPQPGKIAFHLTGDNTYKGTWGESEKRHGTLSFTVSEDGKKIVGTWTADPDCTIAPDDKEGPILWVRE